MTEAWLTVTGDYAERSCSPSCSLRTKSICRLSVDMVGVTTPDMNRDSWHLDLCVSENRLCVIATQLLETGGAR